MMMMMTMKLEKVNDMKIYLMIEINELLNDEFRIKMGNPSSYKMYEIADIRAIQE